MSNITRSSPRNVRERSECRRIILKIQQRDNVSLDALLDDRYYQNFGFGMRCQIYRMLKEKKKLRDKIE